MSFNDSPGYQGGIQETHQLGFDGLEKNPALQFNVGQFIALQFDEIDHNGYVDIRPVYAGYLAVCNSYIAVIGVKEISEYFRMFRIDHNPNTGETVFFYSIPLSSMP